MMNETKVTLTIDAGGTFLKSALVHPIKGVIQDTLFSWPSDSEENAEKIKMAYRKILQNQMSMARKMMWKIECVCIDTPGPFDYMKGISLMKHKYRAIYGVPLIPWIKNIIGDVPVLFLHDSSAFILGESVYLSNFSHIAGVMIGTGLGFAIMENNRVLLNDESGPLVNIFDISYRNGIVEDFASGRGIMNCYNKISIKPAKNAKEISLKALEGDYLALEIFKDVGEILAEILCPILKERGTQALIFGGQVTKSFNLFGESLKAGLIELPELRVVRPSENIDTSHLLGAAKWGKLYSC